MQPEEKGKEKQPTPPHSSSDLESKNTISSLPATVITSIQITSWTLCLKCFPTPAHSEFFLEQAHSVTSPYTLPGHSDQPTCCAKPGQIEFLLWFPVPHPGYNVHDLLRTHVAGGWWRPKWPPPNMQSNGVVDKKRQAQQSTTMQSKHTWIFHSMQCWKS